MEFLEVAVAVVAVVAIVVMGQLVMQGLRRQSVVEPEVLQRRVDGGDVAESRMVKPSAALSVGIAAMRSHDNGNVVEVIWAWGYGIGSVVEVIWEWGYGIGSVDEVI